MIEGGVQTIVEIGPGETLSGLSRRISRDLHSFSVNGVDAIAQFPGRLREIDVRGASTSPVSS